MASLLDPACLVLVSAICASAYLFGLRYYSDDFLFLLPLATSPDQSWSGLYRAIAETPFAAVRPGQILWYVAFHKLAPGNVTLVHLANHAAFAAATLVLYATLRLIRATRPAAWYVALLYACLPTFSVAKMWYANHQAVLGLLAFALTGLLLALIARSTSKRRWLLMPLVTLTAAIGNLFYELFSVTALVLPVFVWWGCGIKWRALPRDPAFLAASAAVALGFVASTLFKLTFDYGFELPGTGAELRQFVGRAAYMYLGATHTTFWTLGLFSPRVAIGVLSSPYLQPGSLIAPLLVLGVVGAREWFVRPDRSEAPALAFLAVSGIVAFGLGYVPYLTNFLYSPKPWGEGNRGNIAAALGAALLIGAALLWARGRWPLLAKAALALFCAIGAFLQVAIGKTWVAAADEQDRVLARFAPIARSTLSDGDVVLLYGTCPYYGAGPVFPYGWDQAARVELEGGPRHLDIGLVQPAMRIRDSGIATPAGRWSRFYRYGTFRVIDMGDGSAVPIASRRDAERYFAAHPLARSITCAFDFGIGNPFY